MVEYERGDHWAHFGDGNSATIIDQKDFLDEEDGIKMTRFILLPSRRMVSTYGIDDQDKGGAIIREYPAINVMWLERGVSRSRCWITVDVEGNPTPVSRREEYFTEALLDSDKILAAREAAKNRMYHELRTELEQTRLALQQKVGILREVMKARGRTDSDDDEVSADLED